jgi:catechol 2,3-dioxygenase-like lactoylglutathione lyase family enzyme
MQATAAFSGFSVDDLAKAKAFYTEVLELKLIEETMGLRLALPGDSGEVFVYDKKDHQPATYTHLNFVVDDIDQAVEALVAKGVTFDQFEGMTDEKGVARGRSNNMGPDIAWFKDSAGNTLAVLQN